MLRHITSVGLAMTICTAFIPISANAATLTVLPSGEIPKKVNDSIEFSFYLDPEQHLRPRPILVELFDLRFDYDKEELRLRGTVTPIYGFLYNPETIVRYTFDVLKPINDGKPDLFNVRISYREYSGPGNTGILETPMTFGGNVVPVPEPSTPVPEPLTIFGTATALGEVILLKRKSYKMKKS